MKKISLKTPQEMRQALIDCSDTMLKIFLGSTKDQEKIERFLLVKTLHNTILGKMSQDDPCINPLGGGELFS